MNFDINNVYNAVKSGVNAAFEKEDYTDEQKQGLIKELTSAYADVLRRMDTPPVSFYIAQNPSRFKTSPGYSSLFGKAVIEKDLFDVRVAMQNATKYLVPIIGYSFSQVYDQAGSDEFWDTVTADQAKNELANFFSSYRDFIRLPVDSMVVENSTGAYWVRLDERWPDGIVFRCMMAVSNNSVGLTPTTFVMYPHEIDEHGFIRVRLFETYGGIAEMKFNLALEGAERFKKMFTRMATLLAVNLAEVLVLLNTANIDVHHYSPTKSELKKIPSVLRNNYDYFVLDIHRMRHDIESLVDMFRFSNGGTSNEIEIQQNNKGKLKFRRLNDELFMWAKNYRNAYKIHNQQ